MGYFGAVLPWQPMQSIVGAAAAGTTIEHAITSAKTRTFFMTPPAC
jgi:hypothetical protein